MKATATKIVARWRYLDAELSDPTHFSFSVMAREIWQAAKLGAQAETENAELRADIIEADSAFNLDGHVSAWDATAGLVRMCHEGRAALDELARYHDAQYAAVAAAQLGMIRP